MGQRFFALNQVDVPENGDFKFGYSLCLSSAEQLFSGKRYDVGAHNFEKALVLAKLERLQIFHIPKVVQVDYVQIGIV
mgnify:CR=1 FL=1